MFSDTALLFWTFVTLAATFGVGAYQSNGGKARNLWIVTALFALLALAIAVGFPSTIERYSPAALRIVWMLYPLLTIVLVAVLIRDRKPAKREHKSFDLAELDIDPKLLPPPFAAKDRELVKWEPDMPFKAAMALYASRTKHPTRARSTEDVKKGLLHSLWLGQVTAWGKAHPKDNEFVQVAKEYWRNADVTLESNFAFSASAGTGVYDVQLSKAQMGVVWPAKAGA